MMLKTLSFALLLMVVLVSSTEDDQNALLKKFDAKVNRAPFLKTKQEKRDARQDSECGADEVCDPLYSDQWHLNKEFLDIEGEGVDMGVQGAWSQGFRGKGVLINFVDDGVQIDHPDLSGYTKSVSYDFETGGSNPSKDADHGTSCAGVAVARRNSVCGVGVAFEANYGGVRLIGAALTALDEAIALTYGLDEVDIYSNSWGPIDDGLTVAPLSPVVSDALEQGVNEGRGGKGSVYMWAGGNGGSVGDSCAYDGYVASRFTIAIGAVDEYGVRSYYSESCASLLGVTTSSGDDLGITTTDRSPPNGYNTDSECTHEFSGTSAATPMGSGVVALMLEANPDLTWRDVQGVLIHTAVKTDKEDPNWEENGAKLLYNPNYGFGLLNATRVVNEALQWNLLKPYTLWDSGKKEFQEEELPAGPDVFDYAFEINSSDVTSNVSKVEHVLLTVDIRHPARNNLTLTLTSPDGTVSTLASPHLQGQIPTFFLVLSPQIEYEFVGGGMGFGTVYDQEASGSLVFVYSCQITNSDALKDAVVMVKMDQETCTPFSQFIAIQNAGAKAVVFVPDYDGEFEEFEGPDESDDNVVVPVMQISRSIGELIMDPEYGFETTASGRVAGIEHLQADYENYPFSSLQFWGESGVGTWKVRIEDDEEAGGTQGTIESLQLTVYGEGFAVPYKYEHHSGFSPVKIFLIVVAVLLVVAVAILVGLYYVKRPATVLMEPEQHDGFGRLEEQDDELQDQDEME